MKADKKLYEHMEFEEGFSNKAYPDSSGYLTIGIGHKLTQSELTSGKIYIEGKPVKWSAGLTDDQVYQVLEADLKKAVDCVNGKVQIELTQNQFNALVSLVFNIGVNAFSGSTLLKLLNAGHYDLVPEQMARWKWSGGKPILAGRRKRDIVLWNTK